MFWVSGKKLYAQHLQSVQSWIVVVLLVLEKGKPWEQASSASPKYFVITCLSAVKGFLGFQSVFPQGMNRAADKHWVVFFFEVKKKSHFPVKYFLSVFCWHSDSETGKF